MGTIRLPENEKIVLSREVDPPADQRISWRDCLVLLAFTRIGILKIFADEIRKFASDTITSRIRGL
jgi:hypothetical protein